MRQVTASISPDPELSYLLELLKIDYHTRRNDFQPAFEVLDSLATKLKNENADIYQRIHLLVVKADLFAKMGQPRRGFSLAMRAASTASKFQIMPLMWDALGHVANVLISLEDFEPARKLLRAVLPSVLDNGDASLSARLCSLSADAHMGLAGQEQDPAGRAGTKLVSQAEVFVDRALECESFAIFRGDTLLTREKTTSILRTLMV
jgi:anaphase-promoting complex subunit 5